MRRDLLKRIEELERLRVDGDAARVVARELRVIGCEARAWDNGAGVTVETWRDAEDHAEVRRRKLDELESKGISTLVVIIDRLDSREDAASGGRVGGEGTGASSNPPARPLREGERASDPPTNGRNDA
jgi:hypothetical protein